MPSYIYLLHSSPEAESGVPPPAELFQAMHEYNTSLSDANMLLAAEGFHASSKGARITFSTDPISSVTTTVGKIDKVQSGPFGLEGLICGFWIVQAKDLENAIEWAKKAPLQGTTLEVRQLHSNEDFGDVMSEEMKVKEEELRKKAEERSAKK